MIGLIAALVLQQTPPVIVPGPPRQPSKDVAASVARMLDRCGYIVEARRRADQAGQRTAGGRSLNAYEHSTDETVVRLWSTDRGCEIRADGWRPEGDRIAILTQAELLQWSPTFTTGKWREPLVTESGPTVWTTFEQHDAEGRVIGVLRIIEPADGAAGELEIVYEQAL